MSKEEIVISELMSTDEFAAALRLRPQSIRKRYNQTGSYWGVRPIKHPNGRLLWRKSDLNDLLNGKKERR